MKKVVLIPVAVFVLLLAALVVIPGFIDWNEYKEEARTLVRNATGRDLQIGGDIKLTLLPAPALSATDVRLANAEGAADADMVSLQTLEVRIKALPLLGGDIQVESVRLIDPVIALEKLPDGGWNWAFESPASATPEAAPTATESPAVETSQALPGIRLDSFIIRNGSVVIRDQAAGTAQRIDGIDAEIKAASLLGPFEAEGSLTAQGIPLAFSLSTSKAIHGRTLTFTSNLDFGHKAALAQISGTLLNLAEAPGVKAKIQVSGEKLSTLLRLFGDQGTLPGALAQPFDLQARVETSDTLADVSEITISLGTLKATGTLVATLAERTAIEAHLAIPHVDLDKLLALPPETASGKASDAGTSAPQASIALPQSTPTESPSAPFALPQDLDATLEITLDALTYRGGLVRQARASGALADGALTLDQVSALLPGGSEVAMFGFVNFPEGKPRFEGSLDGMVADLRGVLKWLDITPPEVAADRLRKLTLKTQVVATADELQLPGLDVTLDSSRLTGGVTVALRDRLAFGVDVELDRLNLDAYLPPETAANGQAASGPSGAGNAPAKAAPNTAAGPDLSALSTVDANLRARVKTLTYQKQPIHDLVIDGTLYQGALTLRQASVKDLAGASANLNGTIKNLDSIPVLQDFAYDIGTGDATGLFNLAGIQPPMPPKQLGRVSLIGTANGSLSGPTLDLTAKAAEATLKTAGKVTLLSLTPGYEGDLSFAHANLTDLMDRLNLGYRPGGKVGAIDLKTKLKATAQAISLDALTLKAGEAAIDGQATVLLNGPRPKVASKLTIGHLLLDPFLPAEGRKGASLTGRARFAELAPRTTPVAAKGTAPWSTEPLDLGALGLLDADLDLTAQSLTFQNYRLDAAELAATLAGGKLDTQKLAGRLFGGALNGRLAADVTGPQPKMGLDLTVTGLDIAKALIAAQGEAKGSGRVDLNTALTTSGGSVAALIQGLNGDGKLALTGIDSKEGAEVDLPLIGAILKLARTLDGGLGGLTGALGGNDKKGLLDAGGAFTVSNGVLSMPALRLLTTAYQGDANLNLDLPAYTMAANGTLSLNQNLVGALLSQIKEVPKSIPFSVSGPLDNPTNVKVDTGSLPGGKLTLPGKLGKGKTGDLLQQILPGILGGGAAPPSPSAPSPAPTPAPSGDGSLPPPPPPPPSSGGQSGSSGNKTQDLLRNILGNIK